MNKTINVFADWQEVNNPSLVGQLYSQIVRGKEVFSFEYDPTWLANPQALALDPSLQMFAGMQYPTAQQQNFGIFLDSVPDRWGRTLLDRREAQQAREEGRSPRKLLESDYLLGVYDAHRIGGLRFKTQIDGAFLDANQMYAAPPWASLRELIQASLALEADGAEENRQYCKWLQMLVAPGGSLGGARPKASVIDENNHLWIAKFPSAHDNYDVGAWEMVVAELAMKAGIEVSNVKAERFNNRYHTFLNKRFDRSNDQKRLHFVSAMTLLQRTDGDDFSNGASYLELAELLMRYGAQPDFDLEQLWRRIVFFIGVSNTDDHLRNHGFILVPGKGWRLSPAYDMNPVPHSHGLKLNISDVDNTQDFTLALDVAHFFRLKLKRSQEILEQVVLAIKQWRKVASCWNLTKHEQDAMSSAFNEAETW